MEKRGEGRLLKFRVPVSDGYWHDYGFLLGLLVAMLAVMAVAVARRLGDGLVVGAAFVTLSVVAVLTGLLVYNVVVAVIVAVNG